MYLPRIGPANKYDPVARQPQQQGLLGPVSSFQPAQIDQGLLSQGMQAQAPRQEAGLDIGQLVKAAVKAATMGDPAAAAGAASAPEAAGAAGAAATPAAPAAPVQQPNPFTSMFNNSLNSILPPNALDNMRAGINSYLPHQQVGAFQNWFNANLNPNNIFRR